MADSACLMRSYSQPSEMSRDFSEGESLRSLGESVSFGRYMTEPLAWEKWSAFTSNRYLEEAEKYSKPGSVAKMKAYFEAHYKNKAAKRQAAKDEQASRSDELEINDVQNCSDFVTPEENLSAFDESNHEENRDAKEEDQRLEENEPVGPEISMENSVQVEAQCAEEFEKDLEKVQCVTLTLDMESSKINDVQEKLNSKVKKPPNLSTGRLPYSKKSKLSVPSDGIVPLNDSNKWQSTTNISQMDQSKKGISQDSNCRRLTYRKPSEIPTFPIKVASLQSSKEGCVTPSKKQTAKDTFIKRLANDASIRFSPRADAIKKSVRTSQKSANENPPTPSAKLMKDKATPLQTPNRVCVFSSAKLMKDKAAPLQTPNRARTPNATSAKPQSEAGRRKATPSHSFAGDRRGVDSQSSCAENTPSSSCVYKVRPFKFSPFNFRTEERATKRRELIQRRQEEAAGKIQHLEKTKPEQASVTRKLLHNIGSKAKPADDTKSSSRDAKKVSG